MTLAEFQKLTSQDLEKMSFKDLSKLVSEQGKKLNKRVARIEKDVRSFHGATKSVAESGGRFGVHGATDKKALILEAKREQGFNASKGSTMKEARRIKEDIFKEIGKSAREHGKEAEKKTKEKLTKERKPKTAKEKADITRQAKKAGQKAENEYNARIDKAWERFHKWKEKNPSLSYAKEKVKGQVNEYAYGDRQRMSYRAILNKGTEKEPDVFTSVNEQLSFI